MLGTPEKARATAPAAVFLSPHLTEQEKAELYALLARSTLGREGNNRMKELLKKASGTHTTTTQPPDNASSSAHPENIGSGTSAPEEVMSEAQDEVMSEAKKKRTHGAATAPSERSGQAMFVSVNDPNLIISELPNEIQAHLKPMGDSQRAEELKVYLNSLMESLTELQRIAVAQQPNEYMKFLKLKEYLQARK